MLLMTDEEMKLAQEAEDLLKETVPVVLPGIGRSRRSSGQRC